MFLQQVYFKPSHMVYLRETQLTAADTLKIKQLSYMSI